MAEARKLRFPDMEMEMCIFMTLENAMVNPLPSTIQEVVDEIERRKQLVAAK
jgi:hypothetical protein